MAQQVFISHSGRDSAQAAAVADFLTGTGIQVRFDRKELCLGDSFLSFMESALTDSDYCLLLWSQNAAKTAWVKAEWEAALYRSVAEKRAFLVTGRLEDMVLPALLAPRLRVDLFPELQPGIGKIVDTWRADRSAELATQRPVAASPIAQPDDSENTTLYVTSDAFGITVPMKVDLDAPAGLLLDRIISAAKLPKIWQFEGRIGVRFTYTLMSGDTPLDRASSLTAQHVREKSVIWLRTRMEQFSEATPIKGSLLDVTLRYAIPFQAKPVSPLSAAGEKYLAAIRKARLGL